MISKKPLHVNLTGLSIFGRLFWKIGRQRLNSAACELFTVPGNLQIITIFGKTSNTTLHILSVCVAITLQEKNLLFLFKIKKTQPISGYFGGWFEGFQKDFWFEQVLGGAQGFQKSDWHTQKKSKLLGHLNVPPPTSFTDISVNKFLTKRSKPSVVFLLLQKIVKKKVMDKSSK